MRAPSGPLEGRGGPAAHLHLPGVGMPRHLGIILGAALDVGDAEVVEHLLNGLRPESPRTHRQSHGVRGRLESELEDAEGA